MYLCYLISLILRISFLAKMCLKVLLCFHPIWFDSSIYYSPQSFCLYKILAASNRVLLIYIYYYVVYATRSLNFFRWSNYFTHVYLSILCLLWAPLLYTATCYHFNKSFLIWCVHMRIWSLFIIPLLSYSFFFVYFKACAAKFDTSYQLTVL